MNKKGSSKGAGAVAIGASVAIFTKLLKSTESIVGLLEIIGGLINQLVAPFVPILLGLIKPVFVLLQKFLFGAMASLGVAGFGGEEGDIGFGEIFIKWLLGILAGAGAAIIATLAGASVGWAVAIGAALLLLVPLLVDFGKWLGERLMNLGAWIGEKLAEGLASIAQLIYDAFGVDLLTPLKNIFNEILDIFGGLIDIVVGIFTLDWEKIKTGFAEVFSSIWEILKTVWTTALDFLWAILKGAFNGLKTIWEWLLSTLKSAITSFANLFIDGLNGLINLLNKVPGVDIDKVGRVGANNTQTTINVTVEGSTDEDTVDKMLRELRKEQVKRGTGSF